MVYFLPVNQPVKMGPSRWLRMAFLLVWFGVGSSCEIGPPLPCTSSAECRHHRVCFDGRCVFPANAGASDRPSTSGPSDMAEEQALDSTTTVRDSFDGAPGDQPEIAEETTEVRDDPFVEPLFDTAVDVVLDRQAFDRVETTPDDAGPDLSEDGYLSDVEPDSWPDLVIVEVTEHTRLGPCAPDSFLVVVRNNGDSPAIVVDTYLVGGSDVLFVWERSPFAEVVRIDPGEELIHEVSARIDGPLTSPLDVLFVADPNNLVPELDETNNEWLHRLEPVNEVFPPADMTVSRVELSPNPAAEDELIRIDVQFENIGDATAFLCCCHMFWTSRLETPGTGPGQGLTYARAIEPGGLTGGTISNFSDGFDLVPQTYTVTVEVDPDDALVETNEDNNTRSTNLVVE